MEDDYELLLDTYKTCFISEMRGPQSDILETIIYLAQIDDDLLRKHPHFCENAQIVQSAVNTFPYVIDAIPEPFLTPSIIELAVSKNGLALKRVPESMKTPDIVNIAVRSRGLALQFVPKPLKTFDVVLASVESDGLALKFVPEVLKTERVVLAAITNCTKSVLQYAPEHLRDDIHIVNMAILKCADSFQYASPTLRDNYDLAWLAIQTNPEMFRHVSIRLQYNEGFLKALNVRDAFQYFPKEFRGNREFILKLMIQNLATLEHVDVSLRNDKEIVLTAISHQGCVFRHASEQLRDDPEVALAAIRLHPTMLRNASPRLLSDFNFMSEALTYYGRGLLLMPKEMQNNRSLVKIALRNNGMLLQELPEYSNDLDMVRIAVQSEGNSLQFASWELCTNKDLVLEAIATASNPELILVISHMQNDFEVCLAAVAKSKYALRNVSKRIRESPEMQELLQEKYGEEMVALKN